MQEGVSVIVCCFNSATRLSKTIQQLSQQKLPHGLNAEIIIVDNGSNDDTQSAAASEWKKSGNTFIDFRIVFEDTPGLSAARDRGIQEAGHEYIIFCDDDNWLNEDYLGEVYKLLSADPELAAVGGFNTGAFEITPPDWFEYFASGYAIGKQGTENYEVLEGARYLVGAGMGFKKSAYLRAISLGYKFYLTDRLGTKVIGGGDVELSYIFKLAGYKIAYSSSLRLSHFMPAVRLTKKYLTRMWHSYPHSWLVFEAYKVLLNKEFDTVKTDPQYWRKLAKSVIISKIRLLRYLLTQKIKGNIALSLPLETQIRYQVYLLRNAEKLTFILKDLHKISQQ